MCSGIRRKTGCIFDDMGRPVQYQNHQAFKLGWKNRLHKWLSAANSADITL